MRIIVTGTTGGIGGAVKAAALSRGHEVVDFNRAEFGAIDMEIGRASCRERVYSGV